MAKESSYGSNQVQFADVMQAVTANINSMKQNIRKSIIRGHNGQNLRITMKNKNSNKQCWVHPQFAAIAPGGGPVSMVIATSTLNFLNLYNGALVIRLVLTWFPNPPKVVVGPLSTICDPYLNLFRGLLPPLGQLDLSPILAFVLLNVATSAAAALPAELPQHKNQLLAKQAEQNALHPSRGTLAWRKRQEGRLAHEIN